MVIQWFPGHMAKTRRLIADNLKIVDVVVELLDARLPMASTNPIVDELVGVKPRVVVLNKSDMADSEATKKWISYYKAKGISAVAIDSITGKGFPQLKDMIKEVLKEKTQRALDKGMKERSARMMVVGIPNVGKSSFINKLAGRASTKTGDTPGITKTKQWIRISGGYELLDTPGILWPRFDDEKTGLHLAFTGAIRDEIYDTVEVAFQLCAYISQRFPTRMSEIYKFPYAENMAGHEILFEIGKRRGCIIAGGEVDLERTSRIVLDEFRACKIGKITLELPEGCNG